MATETLSFDILARDLASSSFRNMGRTASDAAGSVKGLSDRLTRLSGQTARAQVKLDGDKETEAELDKIGVKLIGLGRRVANPNIDLRGFLRARAEITSLELALDRLDHRHVTATVSIRQRIASALTPSFLGGGGGEGGGLLGPLGAGGLIGGGLIGVGLVPSLVGAGIGGLAGLGAVGGGLFGAGQGKKVTTADLAHIKAITTQLTTAVGQQRKDLEQALKDAQQKFQQDVKFYSPFLGLQKSLQGLMKDVLVPLRPVMAPLAAIFTQFGKGLAGLGPQFTALFKASLPFIKQFLAVMLQAGKILLPAFTQALNQMVKSGALQLMTSGLVSLAKGLAAFIVALGPGMKVSAQIFARVCTFIERAARPVGEIITVIARLIQLDLPADVHTGLRAVVDSFDWWRDRLSSIVDAVVGWFAKLPGRVLNALFGFGHSLYAFAHAAFTEFWDAIKSVGSDIWGWLTSWVQRLPGWLRHLLGIKSPSSVFYDIGKNMMLGLAKGIKHAAGHAAAAARSAISDVFGRGAGPVGGDAAENMRIALSMFPFPRSMWPAFNALVMAESGYNRFARNPSSGAYGIPQALPESKLPFAGQSGGGSHAGAQLSWMFGYIRARYGNPVNAWAHEQAFHWYGKGGIIGEPVLGVGLRSGRGYGFGENGPEMVTPASRGGGKVVLELRAGGGDRYGQFLLNEISRLVADNGGGNVQLAFGGRT